MRHLPRMRKLRIIALALATLFSFLIVLAWRGVFVPAAKPLTGTPVQAAQPGGLEQAFPVANREDLGRQEPTLSQRVPTTEEVQVDPRQDSRPALRGRCLDPNLEPIPGMRVSLVDWRSGERDLASMRGQWARGTSSLFLEETDTDRHGEFYLDLPGDGLELDAPSTNPLGDAADLGRFRLCFAREGFGPLSRGLLEFEQASKGDLGQIIVPFGVHPTGVALDEAGSPVPSIEVTFLRKGRVNPGEAAELIGRVVTDQRGMFDLGWRVPDHYLLDVPQYELLSSHDLVLEDSEDEPFVKLTLAAGRAEDEIVGLVRSHAEGSIAGARIYAKDDDGNQWRVTCDQKGTFRIARKSAAGVASAGAAEGPVQFSAVADGYDLTILENRVVWGEHDLDVWMTKAPTLEVSVADERGVPVDSFEVRIQRLGAHPLAPYFTGEFLVESSEHQSEPLVIRDLIRGAYRLWVEPKDSSVLSSSIDYTFVLGEEHQSHEVLHVVLHRMIERGISIRTERGEGVPGCHAQLVQQVPDSTDFFDEYRAAPLGVLTAPQDALRPYDSGFSDREGHLTLRGPTETPLVLRVDQPGRVPLSLPLLRLDGAGDLVVTVKLPGELQILVSEPQVLEELTRSNGQRPMLHIIPQGEDQGEGQRTEEFLELRGDSQTYQLSTGLWKPILELDAQEATLEEFKIDGIQVVQLSIDLAPYAPIQLDGILKEGSVPLAQRELQLERLAEDSGKQTGHWRPISMRTDAEGLFHYEGAPGRYRLKVKSSLPDQPDALAQPAALNLGPGEKLQQEFQLQLGTLRLHIVDGNGIPQADVGGIELHRESESSYVGQFPPSDADGWTQIEECESGAFRLRVLPKFLESQAAKIKLFQETMDPDALTRRWISLGSLSLVPGDVTQSLVTLPPEYGAPDPNPETQSSSASSND